jgi:hypothetical protein
VNRWQYGFYLSNKNKQKNGSKFRREARKKEDVKDTKSKVTGNEGKNIRKTSRKQNIDFRSFNDTVIRTEH